MKKITMPNLLNSMLYFTQLSRRYPTLIGQTLCLSSALFSASASAEDSIEEVLIIGSQADRSALSGSAYLLDTEALEKFDYTDLNRVLTQVPGVYIRTEDGFGLRPNIGIRGATAERSQKITLMEDGILITPAPYSAPAAYYVPNVNRMSNIEIVKGPATIAHGPHTVGGAVNFVTPVANGDTYKKLELTAGSDGFAKYRAVYSDHFGELNYWVDALRYQSDGFKELDGGGDTGFERNDINAKLNWTGETANGWNHQIDVKLGYADESSNETYLGLSDEDFERNPDRRYAASQDDQFETEHTQLHVIYQATVNSQLAFSSKAYFNHFERDWDRFSGFVPDITVGNNRTDTPIAQVLSGASDSRLLQIVRGETNSSDNITERLAMAGNDRTYGSHGLQLDMEYRIETERFGDHDIDAGVRYHHDYVERMHSLDGFRMIDGDLVSDGVDRALTVFNEASTDAIALYLSDTIRYEKFKTTFGLRTEFIDGTVEDFNQSSETSRRQTVVSPSIGVSYFMNDNWTLLAGVYRGFSPAGPSSDESVDPEFSVNYEYGFRYEDSALNLDLIAFFSDYSNLIGRCRASDSGCDVGDEFNGGEVEVFGVEMLANRDFTIGNNGFIPLSFSYTFSDTAFQTQFESGFSQWGTVQEGDELPYVPSHQLRLNSGYTHGDWQWNIGAAYVSETRETPGQGEIVSGDRIESLLTIDSSLRFKATSWLSLMLAVDNLTDEREIVSRRPFGARPSKPRTINASLFFEF